MFCDPIQVAYFPQRGNKRGNWFENAGLHAGAVSTPDYSPPRVCSYSSVYLYKLRWNPMGEHWMFMPEAHVACHLEVGRDSFIWGIPNSCLICPHHCKLWPTALDAPFLVSSLLIALYWVKGPARSTCPLCPRPHTTDHPWGHGQGCILPPWYVTEIHKESLVLLSTWKRQYGSVPRQICVDRNVTYTGESSFISFFCKQRARTRDWEKVVNGRQRADLTPASSALVSWGFTGGGTGLCICRTQWSFQPNTDGIHYNIFN